MNDIFPRKINIINSVDIDIFLRIKINARGPWAAYEPECLRRPIVGRGGEAVNYGRRGRQGRPRKKCGSAFRLVPT